MQEEASIHHAREAHDHHAGEAHNHHAREAHNHHAREAHNHHARGSIYTLCKKKHPPIMQEEAHTMRDSPIFNHTANSVHCTVLCTVECTSTYVDLSFGSEFGFTFCFSDDSLPGLRFSSGLHDFTLLQG